EADYDHFYESPSDERIGFWLQELRTPELLVECAERFPSAAETAAARRPAVRVALDGDAREVERLLADEQALEMARDRAWWEPLRRELEAFRRERWRRPR
ncbi:MAG TPA: hypothetical protein VM778_03960, partial [Gemmatimonadota bacterium]|nr:hypothetical protein [Gemmatimonadota bacterium]